MAYEFQLIRVEQQAGVTFATIDNPPINLITPALFRELAQLARELAADDAVRVCVLRSANPDFFLAHFDVAALIAIPTDQPAQRGRRNEYHVMCETFRTMPKVTIAQIEGRVGGGGSELAASCDLRYGVRGRTFINQMEVPLGILPGGTGTQRLPRLLGRGRAIELIFSGDDLDAETAERWGYLDRVFDAADIAPWVRRLATRMASFPAPAIRAAKTAINAADLPLTEGLVEEAYLFQTLLRTSDAQRNMRRFLEIGGQTRAGEQQVAVLNERLGSSDDAR